MGPDATWPRVRALFEEVVALPPHERAQYLAQLGPAEAPLRTKVERLLEAETHDDDGFLEPPFPADSGPDLVGRRIAGYRVVRPIASGGMGSVWEAEQHEPRRRVALKTMRAGIASPRGRRRFRLEAELLAGLRHPAIAQVYGVGVLEDERGGPSLPWFALEFVDGARSLPRYAEEEKLDLAARLRLFQRVCSAVQHAHQRGVIHRDLKAANLLVDRDGHVKVIDFGIARLVERRTGGAPRGETLAGEIIGTLEAMSPEQVAGRHDEVDARSDIYALGVALYELCTGRRPFELDDLPLPEAARRICEDEPSPPSRLDPSLPREIDWIVQTAMAKEPARRYAAALDVERDIERLLARQPVLAGPPSKTYRVRKFCERHRAGVTAAAIGLFALMAGVVGAVYGLLESANARTARTEARVEAAVVERFSTFLVELFRRSAPEEADGRELTADQIIDRGAVWIREQLDDRPLVQARLLRTVGLVYNSLGQYEQARGALTQAVDIARRQGAPAERELARALLGLGQVHRLLDDRTRAEAAYREALAIEERQPDADHGNLGPLCNELGLLVATSDPDEAIRLYEKSLALVNRHRGEDTGDAGILLANIGAIQLRTRHYQEAIESLERALPLLIDHHGERDPRTSSLLGNLAIAHANLGNYERAAELQRRDLELSTAVLGEDHPTIGVALMSLARITDQLGDSELALEQTDRAIAIFARRFAPAHSLSMIAQLNRARFLLRTDRFDDARTALESVLAADPDSDQGRFTQLAAAVVLAELERLEGRLARSLELASGVLADPLSADDEKLTADAHWARAYVLAQQGQHAEADAERGLAMRLRPVGPSAEAAPHAFADAKFYAAAGDHERALEILARAVEAGYRSMVVMAEPAFAALRRQPGFAPIAARLGRPAAK